MPHSTRTPAKSQAKRGKRPKLGRHPRGYWYKKYQGRFLYFYKIEDDPQCNYSLEKWEHDERYLKEGIEPPPYDPLHDTKPFSGVLTVKDLCNHWIAGKDSAHQSGELAKRTFDEYFETCEILISMIGGSTPVTLCTPQKFIDLKTKLGKRFKSPNTRYKRIIQIRSIFNTAHEDQLISVPVVFGKAFRPPSATTMRKHRAAKGDQSITAEELRLMLNDEKLDLNLRAFILLGIQAGFGNSDCAHLPQKAVNDGWIHWARIKNGVPRKVPLWPETIEAIEAAIKHARSLGEKKLCFIRQDGMTFIHGGRENGEHVGHMFRTLRDRLGINRSFYDLRRTFETIGGESIDQVAVDIIMGHIPKENDMAARYRQRVSDERLQAVVNHVRAWLGLGVDDHE